MSSLASDRLAEHTAVVFPARQTNSLGVIRSLGSKGISVIALDCQPMSVGFYSRYSRGMLCPDPLEEEDRFIDFLLRLGDRIPGRGVLFLMDDHLVLFATKYRLALESRYRFPYLGLEVAIGCMDKRRMHDLAKRCRIPVPRTLWPEEGRELAGLAGGLTFPCIIKPVGKFELHGDSPKEVYRFFRLYGKAIRVSSPGELTRRWDEVTRRGFQVIVQEEIPGDASRLFSLGAYCNSNGDMLAAFTGRKLRQAPPDFGTCTMAEGLSVPELVEYGSRFLKEMGYWGIAELEFKKDVDGSFRFLEINPRAWTWISLAEMCGVDIPLAAYLDMTEREVPPYRQRACTTKWTDLAKDILCFMRYRKGGGSLEKTSLREWLRSLRGPKRDIYFDSRDMLPGICIPLQLLRSRFDKRNTSF